VQVRRGPAAVTGDEAQKTPLRKMPGLADLDSREGLGGERSGSQKTCPIVSTVTVPSGKGPLVVESEPAAHRNGFRARTPASTWPEKFRN